MGSDGNNDLLRWFADLRSGHELRALVVVVLALAAVGCGAGDDGTVVLGERDSGREVEVATGAQLLVELESNASTGHRWVPAALPPFLELRDDSYEEPDSDLVGAPGTQVVTVEAVARGAGVLRLEYVRPFDDPPIAERIVEFVVRVDGAPWPPERPGTTPGTATATADVAVGVADLPGTERGPVTVRGFVVWDDEGARLCATLLESFPAQCGGAAVEVTDPGVLDVEFEEAEGVRWTPAAVVIDAVYDGRVLTVD
jgi:predicted secreted protein